MAAQVELYKSGSRAIAAADLFALVITHDDGSKSTVTLTASEWSQMISNPKTLPLCGAG